MVVHPQGSERYVPNQRDFPISVRIWGWDWDHQSEGFRFRFLVYSLDSPRHHLCEYLFGRMQCAENMWSRMHAALPSQPTKYVSLIVFVMIVILIRIPYILYVYINMYAHILRYFNSVGPFMSAKIPIVMKASKRGPLSFPLHIHG